MTKKLETLKEVLNDIAERSKEIHEAQNLSKEEKALFTAMYDAKADAILEVGIAMLCLNEFMNLRHYRNNVIDLY